MKVLVESKEPFNKITEVVVVAAYENKHLDGSLIELDRKLGGAISEIMAAREFEGKYGHMSLIHTGKKIAAKRVLLVGLGKRDELTLTRLGHIAGRVSKHIRQIGLKEFCTTIYGINERISLDDAVHTIIEWSILGQYRYDEFKTEDEKKREIEFITILTEKGKEFFVSDLIKGPIIEANAANYTRSLSNIPANIATTEYIANESKRLAKELGISCKIYDEIDLKKMGMNALVGVGQGSTHPPKLVVLEYAPKNTKKTIAILGKTIIFDSGGLSLKSAGHMIDMKFDKIGGCTVLGIMKAVIEKKLPIRIIGILSIAENLPGGSAQRPGDIVVSASGKTIEIVNTDAEGRLVLADAIHHSLQFKPDLIIDLATLTGAIGVALGKVAAGLFGNDRKTIELMKRAGDKSTERVWELPVWDDYNELIRSNVADVKNHTVSGEAGSIAAAMFLKKFVKNTPWIHLDIADTSYHMEDTPYLFNGSNGFGVRLVTEFLELLEKEN